MANTLFIHVYNLCYLSQFNSVVIHTYLVNFCDVFVGSCSFYTSRTFVDSKALTPTFKFSYPKFPSGKSRSRVLSHRLQLIFDLRRRIAFQKQIFNNNSTTRDTSVNSNEYYVTTASSKWLKLWKLTLNRWTTEFNIFHLRVLPSLLWDRKHFRLS